MRRTIQEQIRDNTRRAENLEGMLGIGTVSSVNKVKRTAKVILDDDETVSDDFPVISRKVHCDHCGKDYDWMPKKTDVVAYLIRPGGDGIILGGV
jgi:hypothetical protein